ncbi:hypothetical protein J5X84_39030 [Streptosporangiaceae bacterium NEAU-GS5]|nr:hypothetical protein [Streptosporangiaceae bacterium NEAU-GS5]
MTASGAFAPVAPSDWQTTAIQDDPSDSLAELDAGDAYSLIFEATYNTMAEYDPVVRARAIRRHFAKPPEVLVALVAEIPEIPSSTQHALAYEVGVELRAGRVHIVKGPHLRRQPSTGKAAKPDRPEREMTSVRHAVHVAVGAATGREIDDTAERFAYAYTSQARSRTPFRCTPLQRRILQAVAAGDFVPTMQAIAARIRHPEKGVGKGIAELTDEFVPRVEGARNSMERLSWIIFNFGPWIRLVEQRPAD